MGRPLHSLLMELGGLCAGAAHKDHPRRCELNASEQGCETADKHQPESRFTVGTFHACRCPQQRNETEIISCLHVTVQKDSCPDDCRRHRPCTAVSEGLLDCRDEEREHTQ